MEVIECDLPGDECKRKCKTHNNEPLKDCKNLHHGYCNIDIPNPNPSFAYLGDAGRVIACEESIYSLAYFMQLEDHILLKYGKKAKDSVSRTTLASRPERLSLYTMSLFCFGCQVFISVALCL